MEAEISSGAFQAWHVYSVIGLMLIGAEVFVPGFIMLPVGLAFVMTALAAAFLPSLTVQLVILAVSSLVMFFLFRQWAQKIKGTSSGYASNVEAMIGKEALVTEEIDNRKGTGYVKLYGDSWRALSSLDKRIATSKTVKIDRVDGNKVFVVEPE
jgi:membrane protein implicated in regulation of membrane protease activity